MKEKNGMKAIVITPDRHLTAARVPFPSLKSGEVLIEVYAAAVNRADLLQREGSYPPPPGCPDWPGLEVSGKVYAVAEDVTRFAPGDEVCALLGGGGYAEYVAVPDEMVMPKPKNISFEEAAAIPEVYATAYLNLFWVGNAQPGETLLMNAGASGLAGAVIPMAKSFGLRVITTVRGQEKVKAVAYLHADRVVDTLKEDIAEVLKEEEAGGHPVNLAIDCLGGDALGRCLPYVAKGCRWIQIATLAGDVSAVDFKTVYVKNIHLIGSTLRSKTPEEKGQVLRAMTEKLWSRFEDGSIAVPLYRVLPLDRAEEAQDLLYRGLNVGKVALTVKTV
ncbi:MAG: NAD(P)H-quinone oxidoreductase [Clostridia bacterium]|nr:NAD(P)H-quinone oxidoreductase [Clostridia bacterium]